MDFLINNIGWFFCIAIVSILALIGYKADTKEKKQNNTNNKYIPKEQTYEDIPEETKEEQNKEDAFYYNAQDEIKPIENNESQIDEEMAALYEPLHPMQSQNKTEETIKKQEENPINDLYYSELPKEFAQETQQPIEQEEPVQIVPDINNLENLNISLQDLENKNYNQLLSKMNKQEEQIQSEVQENEIVQQNDNQSLEQNDTDANQETHRTTQQEYPTSLNNEINQISEQQADQNQESQQYQIEENNQNVENTREKYNEYNNETNDIEIESSEQQDDQFAFNTQENKYEGEIPEIFTNAQQNNEQIKETNYLERAENSNTETENETNLYNDSIDDDIWKF